MEHHTKNENVSLTVQVLLQAVLKEKENGKKVAKKTQKGKKKEVLLLPKVTSTTATTALDDKDLSLELIELSQGSSVSNSQGSTLGSQQEIPDILVSYLV